MSQLIDTILDGVGDLIFRRNDVEVARLDSSGNITAKAGSLVGTSLAAGAGVTSLAGKASVDNPMPRIISLISGSDDETGILSNCTAVADTTNFKVGDRGWQLTSIASGFMTFALDPPSPQTVSTAALTVPPWQALGMWIYVPDVTKLVTNDVEVRIYTDDALNAANKWGKNCSSFPAQTLVNGWNLIRISPLFGYLNNVRSSFPASPTTIYRVAVIVNTNAIGAQVTIGHVWLEARPKATLMLVADRGYQSFIDSAYPQLKAAGIPVTFAVDTTLMGTGSGTSAVMSQATLDTLATENGNSVSFHGYDGSTTSGMTAAQLRADTVKAQKFCQAKGYAGRMWRAAFVQQNAPQYAAIRNYVVASASGVTADADNMNIWPPLDLLRISRRAFDNSGAYTTTTLDAAFAFLQQTYGLDVYFMHGISTDGARTFDTSPALFAYWLAKVQAAVAAGWLEVVTFEQLFFRSGGKFNDLSGSPMATYLDATGAVVTKNVI